MSEQLTNLIGIKIRELGDDPDFTTARIAISGDPDTGKLYKVTMQQWANLLSAVGVSYKGPATTTTDPGSPTDPEFYSATATGTYTNFKDSDGTALAIADGDGLVIFSFDGTAWEKQVISITDGIASQKKVATRSTLSFFPLASGSISFDSETKKLTINNYIYILNGQSYYRINPGVVDIGAYITANPAQDRVYVYKIAPAAFMDGTYSGGSVDADTLLISGYKDSNSTVRNENAIVLFTYDTNSGYLISPFFEGEINSFDSRISALETKQDDLYLNSAQKSYAKMIFSLAGDFTWDSENYVLSWSGYLYIFNGSGKYNRIGNGSGEIDFGAAVTANPSANWFVAYVNVIDDFLKGTDNYTQGSITVKPWNDSSIADIQSPNNIIIATYYKVEDVVSSPFLKEKSQTYYLNHKGDTPDTDTKESWKNEYPNVLSKLSGFVQKYFYGLNKTAEDRTRIIMLGDSLFARENHNSIGDVIPASFPPGIVTKNFSAWLWEKLKGNKPVYNRFDTTGRFTETGTFTTVTDDATWDDNNDRPTDTRLTTDANASIAFTVGTDYNYFNLIDRTDTAGTTAATVAVTEGDGKLLAKVDGDSSWVEANGFSFSQKQTTGTYVGNTLYQRRILFKKTGSGSDTSITITISKGNDSSRLLYWGLEEIPGAKPYVQLLNIARGSHTLAMLQNYYNGDVIDRKPDLVLFELPLINMINADSSLSYSLNWVQDFIWGDREGNTNTWNLKYASNNWQDFQILVVIPHFERSAFDTNGNFIDKASGYTAEEIYQAVKGLLYSKGDVPFVDMANAMMAEADADPLFSGNYYTAFTASGHTGTSYLDDNTHANDKGAAVWAKNLCPIFWVNTL